MAKAKDPPGIPPGKTYDGLSYLTCDTIGDLDHGLARETIDDNIREVMKDIEQRGTDGKVREVNIKLKFTQVSQDEIRIEFESNPKFPTRFLAPTTAVMRRAVGEEGFTPAFRADNPTRPDQPTIPYGPESADDGAESE